VFGAGSWGTTFASVVADSGVDTIVWAREPSVAKAIQVSHQNPVYLPDRALAPSLRATHDPEAALDGVDLVVFAVPSQFLRENLRRWAPALPRSAVLVSLMKGVELGTLKRMSEVIEEVCDVPPERVAAVSGPNLAQEIAARQPAATVVACPDLRAAELVQSCCTTGYFRPYTNPDVIGTELGGAVKNVIAIAVGMAGGMGFGDNSKASLITRGLAETARLGVALGADLVTFSGLAGLGDLVATCSSPLSRNRTVGEKLGLGHSLQEIQGSMRMIAEGVKSSESILELARTHGVEMPITEHVVAVVHDGMPVTDAVSGLMSRELKAEVQHP
jgi:glycerol-3-phosphate dehydrogenase (NAD(P)+)